MRRSLATLWFPFLFGLALAGIVIGVPQRSQTDTEVRSLTPITEKELKLICVPALPFVPHRYCYMCQFHS
jgi:hypothetical protein